jgi:hypothetical protein
LLSFCSWLLHFQVWGTRQQARNISTNLAVSNLNLWMQTLVELWEWHSIQAELCDHSDSPWDDFESRPSRANRRKALRRFNMRHESSTLKAPGRLPREFPHFAEKFMSCTASPNMP